MHHVLGHPDIDHADDHALEYELIQRIFLWKRWQNLSPEKKRQLREKYHQRRGTRL
ncbi:MAG: hypothetical protein PVI00_01540 [Desulfobacterales bacterium]|jgi:hypothetical protein